jgi:hypothetical protein
MILLLDLVEKEKELTRLRESLARRGRINLSLSPTVITLK